jgi:uncharacterized protein
MNWSKFNRIYPLNDEQYAIYNYAWNKAIVVVRDLKKIVDDNMGHWDKLSSIHPDFYAALTENRMLVKDLQEEVPAVKEHILSKLSSRKTLHLTINPTMDCNVRCWYCYEKHGKQSYMGQETTESIYKFIQLQLARDIKDVMLAFFGGEPLLTAQKRAIPIAKEIIRLCKENGKTVSLHFTTNGTLLTPKISKQIADLGVKTTFQIAFDGGKELHDATKIWGRYSAYDTLLKNIDAALARNLDVVIRCNYTSKNVASFRDLLNDLTHLPNNDKEHLRITYQKIWQEKATLELEKQVDELNDYAIALGYNSEVAGEVCAKSYCYADYDNSFVINYNGDVYKCTARDFDEKYKIGELKKDGHIEFRESRRHHAIRFKEVCDTCSLLPICTICSQMHIEHGSESCPVNIPEEDKERQIKNRFNELYKHLF